MRQHRPQFVGIALSLGLAACVVPASTVPQQPGPGPAPIAAPPPPPAPPPPAPPPPVVVAPPPMVVRPPPPPVVVPPPPVRVDERRDDRRDRAFDRASDWDKLGEHWVAGGVDRDVIKVGKRDGRFVALAIVAEHSALELFDMVVYFGDGTSYAPAVRALFGPGSTSRVIDLPGDARVIERVEFRYGNLPGGGKAQLELWGLDARRDTHDGKDGKGKGKGRGKHRD